MNTSNNLGTRTVVSSAIIKRLNNLENKDVSIENEIAELDNKINETISGHNADMANVNAAMNVLRNDIAGYNNALDNYKKSQQQVTKANVVTAEEVVEAPLGRFNELVFSKISTIGSDVLVSCSKLYVGDIPSYLKANITKQNSDGTIVAFTGTFYDVPSWLVCSSIPSGSTLMYVEGNVIKFTDETYTVGNEIGTDEEATASKAWFDSLPFIIDKVVEKKVFVRNNLIFTYRNLVDDNAFAGIFEITDSNPTMEHIWDNFIYTNSKGYEVHIYKTGYGNPNVFVYKDGVQVATRNAPVEYSDVQTGGSNYVHDYTIHKLGDIGEDYLPDIVTQPSSIKTFTMNECYKLEIEYIYKTAALDKIKINTPECTIIKEDQSVNLFSSDIALYLNNKNIALFNK